MLSFSVGDKLFFPTKVHLPEMEPNKQPWGLTTVPEWEGEGYIPAYGVPASAIYPTTS